MRYQCNSCEFETDNVNDLHEIEEREIGEWCDAGDATPAGQCPTSKKGDDPRFPLRCLAAVYDTGSKSWRAVRFAELMREWFWQEDGEENEVGGADTVDFATETLVNLGFGPPPHPDNMIEEPVEEST